MKHVFILIFIWTVLGANAQNYQPVKGRIMTSWGEKVTPGNAWKDYPRPQLKRMEWQNLNGLWEYSVVPKESARPSEFQGQILVPFAIESALSGVGQPVLPEQKLWYKRTFEIPANWKDKNTILHFESVDWETSVWLNGKLVGTHKGGSTAFSFDITRYLKKGPQELIVSVWDPTDQGTQARGKQMLSPRGIWYTPVTGIWKTVWIEPVPKTFIQSVYPVADIDNNQVRILSPVSGMRGGEQISVKVLKDKKIVAEKLFAAGEDHIMDIPSPELWSPAFPELYQLELTLFRNKQELDKVNSYFAMRKISIAADKQGFQRILLNNQPLFQFGTLDQGWWPDGLLTPPSSEAMKYDLIVLKEMGFNMLRKHIKVEPALYYYYADSLGLMLWQDMVSGFESAKGSEQHVAWESSTDWVRPEESARQFEYELKEELDQLKFFPSIVTWVIFNEGWGQYDTRRLVDWSMSYDTTRIINGVSGWTDRNCGHMIDAHQYPGPGMEPAALYPGRVSVLGEFGGLGLPVENHLWNPKMRNWGYRNYSSTPELIKEYTKLIHNLYPLRYQGLAAAVYTQTTDVEGEVNGLMTYDRKVIKMDPDLLRILHAPLYSSDNHKVEYIFSDSEIQNHEIRFTKKDPGPNWMFQPQLNNTETNSGPVEVKKDESVWLTGSFELAGIPDGISLRILAYGAVKVYLNGTMVLDRRVIGKRHYEDFNISEFKDLLRTGNNHISVSAEKFEAEGLFDLGFYRY